MELLIRRFDRVVSMHQLCGVRQSHFPISYTEFDNRTDVIIYCKISVQYTVSIEHNLYLGESTDKRIVRMMSLIDI